MAMAEAKNRKQEPKSCTVAEPAKAFLVISDLRLLASDIYFMPVIMNRGNKGYWYPGAQCARVYAPGYFLTRLLGGLVSDT
jgi:hypothetical protein